MKTIQSCFQAVSKKLQHAKLARVRATIQHARVRATRNKLEDNSKLFSSSVQKTTACNTCTCQINNTACTCQSNKGQYLIFCF